MEHQMEMKPSTLPFHLWVTNTGPSRLLHAEAMSSPELLGIPQIQQEHLSGSQNTPINGEKTRHILGLGSEGVTPPVQDV